MPAENIGKGSLLPGGRPRIALVGNAPIKHDLSGQIDSCDLVIRCNEAKNIGPNTGSKTDVLCVNNSGEPARRFINCQSLRKERGFPNLSQVWFARGGGYFLRLSEEIITANDLQDVSIRYFSKELDNLAYDQFRRYGAAEGLVPSTGFLALLYILQQKEFEHFEKYVFGFTFDIWFGHPAETEMKIIEAYCRSRDDLHFVPAEAFWKLKRFLKGYHFYALYNRMKLRLKSGQR